MRIDRLEPSKHIKGRYLLYLADERVVKVTEDEVVRFALCSGRELEEEQLREIVRAGAASNAKALAAKMIGARPLSRKELIKRLEEKEISPENAQMAADWLERIGALDDAAFAGTIVRHYSRKGYGLRKLQDELYRRGIPRELWEEALEEAESPEAGIDRFLQSKLKGRVPDDREKKKLSDALLRRGYSWSQVREGLNRFGSEVFED